MHTWFIIKHNQNSVHAGPANATVLAIWDERICRGRCKQRREGGLTERGKLLAPSRLIKRRVGCVWGMMMQPQQIYTRCEGRAIRVRLRGYSWRWHMKPGVLGPSSIRTTRRNIGALRLKSSQNIKIYEMHKYKKLEISEVVI